MVSTYRSGFNATWVLVLAQNWLNCYKVRKSVRQQFFQHIQLGNLGFHCQQ